MISFRTLHLLERGPPEVACETIESPVLAHLGASEVLVHGRQFERQEPVQCLDDVLAPPYGRPPS